MKAYARWFGSWLLIAPLAPALLAPQVAHAAPVNRIGQVAAKADGAKTVVTIRTSGTPSFTAYRLDRPARLVVDIANGTLEGGDLVDVDSWAVGQIASTEYNGSHARLARVMIGLKRAATYDVKADGNNLVVTITADEAPKAMPTGPSAAERQQLDLQVAEAQAKKARAEASAAEAEQAKKRAEAARANEESKLAALQQARISEEAKAEERSRAIAAESAANQRAESARRETQAAKEQTLAIEAQAQLTREKLAAAKREIEQLAATRAREQQRLAELQQTYEKDKSRGSVELGRLQQEREAERRRVESLRREADALVARRDQELAKLTAAQADARRAIEEKTARLEEANQALALQARVVASLRATEEKRAKQQMIEAQRLSDAAQRESATQQAQTQAAQAMAAAKAEQARVEELGRSASKISGDLTVTQKELSRAKTELESLLTTQQKERAQLEAARAEARRLAQQRTNDSTVAQEGLSAALARLKQVEGAAQKKAELAAQENEAQRARLLAAQETLRKRQTDLDAVEKKLGSAQLQAAERDRELRRLSEARQQEEQKVVAARASREQLLSELRQLEAQRITAQRELSTEVRRAQEERAKLSLDIDGRKREQAAIEAELRRSKTQQAELEAQIQKQKQEQANGRSQELRVKEQQAALVKALADRRAEQAQLESVLYDKRREWSRLDSLLTQKRHEQSSLDSVIEKKRGEQSSLDSVIEQKRGEQSSLDGALEKKRGEQAQLAAMIEKRRSEQAQLDAMIEKRRSEQAAIDAMIGRRRGEESSLDGALEKKRSEQSKLSALIEKKRNEQGTLDALIERKRSEQGTLDALIEQRRAEQQALEQKISATRSQQGDLDAQLASAKQELQRVAATMAEAKKKLAIVPTPSRIATPAPVTLTEIRDVRFVDDGNVARVVVDVDRAVGADVVSSDGRVTVLRLGNTTVSKRLVRTLDAAAYRGPVRTVSTYVDPEDPHAVRIAVALDPKQTGLVPQVTREPGSLAWEFARGTTHARSLAPTTVAAYGVGTIPLQASGGVAQAVPGQPGGGAIGGMTQPGGTRRRKVYSGRRIDLDFKDYDIHNMLRLLSDVGQVNIVTADDVKGAVTIRMRDVPWDQALDVILRSKGLGMQREGNLIRVAPAATLEKELEAEIARAKAQVELKPVETRLIPLSYANAMQMSARVQDIMSSRGKVSIDERTNMLIVSDVGANIALAEELVRNLDTQTPQVNIEARIVEARSNFLRTIGIQWGGSALASPATGNPTGLVFPSTIGLGGGATDQTAPVAGLVGPGAASPNYAVNLPAPVGTGSGGALGLTLGSVAGNFNINLRLSALENTGQVRIVSSPKITTLDNVEATIEQGVAIPISVVSAAGTNTIFVDAKLNLTVKPHVTNEGSVIMKVNITRNEPDFVNTGARGDPTILKKQAKTEMLVRDGDTAVIGGIYTRNSGVSYSKVPGLGDIPILGWLFKTRRENDDRTELLIFITPRIVNRAAVVRR